LRSPVLRDWRTLDVLHDEVRPALGRGGGVEDPRNIRVVHDRQRLALVGEAREYLSSVHAEFHDFESHVTPKGFALLGQVHGAHPPLSVAFVVVRFCGYVSCPV
jgi:hypothetical protein